jgi:putative FmdB family regulatory protein
MPTYEYTCRDCGHTFDIVQKMTDEPLTVCPDCGGSLRKVYAVPAIAFKGSGFYATDHGKKSKRSSETSEKAGATGDKKDGSSKEGSGESKGGASGSTPKKKESTSSTSGSPKESAAS